jgi:hypothetical protein
MPAPAIRLSPDGGAGAGDKSLFASFSSEKEDSSFFEKKEAKKLLFLAASIRFPAPRAIRAGSGRRR